MTTDTRSMLAAALELAGNGWPVHPLAGKTAATPHGFKDATTDPKPIRGWWTRAPDRNIGIAVPVGMVVVDVDPRHGAEDALALLERRHGPLPATLTTITGSGGRHHWYATVATDLEQRKLAPGLDTRVGGRGYVVAPPSAHPDTGRLYTWAQPALQVAQLPAWVCALLRPAQKVYAPPTGHRTIGDASGLLGWAEDRVAAASPGSRHDTLRSTSRLLGGWVTAGVVREDEARQAMRHACAGWGSQHKDHQTIESALAHGRLSPVEVSR